MAKNVGTGDRAVRLVLGALVLAAGLALRSWWGALGLVLMLTAAAGRCPLYVPLGISTLKRRVDVPRSG